MTGGDEEATLFLHGCGRSCTEASHFTAWTLLLSGSKATASFYGNLDGRNAGHSAPCGPVKGTPAAHLC